MTFTAIDFETANRQWNSACSIGIIKVKDGQIVEKDYHLIRPPENFFAPFNITIHGITPEMVENEPDFSGVWPKIKHHFEGSVVLAHNAGFDLGVLRQALQFYNLTNPTLDYSCTVVLSRKVWPELHSHGLSSMAEFLNIKFKHHNALEDAFACATIAIEAGKKIKASSLIELQKKTGVGIGKLFPGGYKPATAKKKPKKKPSQRFY